MAELPETLSESETSHLTQTINQPIPLGDMNSSLIITNHRLDGKNFLQWSQSVLMPLYLGVLNSKRGVTQVKAERENGLGVATATALVTLERSASNSMVTLETQNQRDTKALLSSNTSSSTENTLDVRLTKSQLEALHKILETSTAHGSLAIQGTEIEEDDWHC
ncbi:hypothetical protein HRI_001490600 [Hibiscus trionum]|uniref:Retrotransposon Copia-like N-terminal domain-containing protein n=1 Tax=Hibiscus trionum TaxID=183268 RepID=A0A9W7LVM5_HIBTR|nr:hypothetical protein HRI_001490600 [Hibiscus trionum]